MAPPQSPEPAGEQKLAARAIIRKYARTFPKTGEPMRCTPSQWEIHNPALRVQGQRTDSKFIYNTRGDAADCARELEAIGYDPQRPHECRRSRHGHYHLTRDNARRREGARA